MKCLIVMRHLPGCAHVVSKVITCASYENMSPLAFKAALRKEAELHIEGFRNEFVEFRSAEWYSYVFEIDEYNPTAALETLLSGQVTNTSADGKTVYSYSVEKDEYTAKEGNV